MASKMLNITTEEMEKVPMVKLYRLRIEPSEGVQTYYFNSKDKSKLELIISLLDQSKINSVQILEHEARDIYGCDENHVYETLLSFTNFIS